MLWKLVERQPRTRRYRRRPDTRTLPQKWADDTLVTVVATNLCASDVGACGRKPPPGHIVGQLPPDWGAPDDGKAPKMIDFHVHNSRSGPEPVHLHRLVPYDSPWEDIQNLVRFRHIKWKVSHRKWKYLALMDHVHRKITAAALRVQNVVIPETFLRGQDRSQLILDGCIYNGTATSRITSSTTSTNRAN